MTESAAMQHLRRVRARKEQAAGQPQFRVVLTARDYALVGDELRAAAESEGAGVSVCARKTGTSPAGADREASVHGLQRGYQWDGEPSEAEALPVVPGQVQSCLHKETDTATEGSPGVFETKSAQVMRLWNGYQ